jgi:hypothetical protein
MRSKFLRLNWRDILQGIVVAVITAVLTAVYELIPALIAGSAFTWENVKIIALVALGATVSYLLKNVFQNTRGDFGSEPVKFPDV